MNTITCTNTSLNMYGSSSTAKLLIISTASSSSMGYTGIGLNRSVTGIRTSAGIKSVNSFRTGIIFVIA